MGRPLFSQSHTPSAPAVREEPDQAQQYEHWTYWNPFDPDSEEFFANAEVETPVEVTQGDDATRTPIRVQVSSPEDSDEEELSVEELDSRIRRGLPSSVRRGANMEESAFTYRAVEGRITRVATTSTPTPIFPTYSPLATPPLEHASQERRVPQSPAQPRTPVTPPVRVSAIARDDRDAFTFSEHDFEYFDRASSDNENEDSAPSTPPPRTPQMEAAPLLPSPPPTVTPRIYTWGANRASMGAPPNSPTPAPATARPVQQRATQPIRYAAPVVVPRPPPTGRSPTHLTARAVQPLNTDVRRVLLESRPTRSTVA